MEINNALRQLYTEMQDWGQKNHDKKVAKRKVEAVHQRSRLFIVGQDYAEDQVRCTGVQWFNMQGKLGPSAHYLEEILNCVKYTLYPPVQIPLPEGTVLPSQNGLKTAYTTDIFPCYSPKVRPPTSQMIEDALGEGFLESEFEILKPKVVLLLGGASFEAFHRHILKMEGNIGKLSSKFFLLSPATVLQRHNDASVIPFLYPNSPTFSPWFSKHRAKLCEQPQVQAIRKALSH